MAKKLYSHTILLMAALGLAYFSSMPQKNHPQSSQDWLSITPNEIVKISYLSKEQSLEIIPDAQRGFWAKLEDHLQDNAKKMVEKQKNVSKNSVKEFKLSQRFLDLLKKFQPLTISRMVGKSEEKNLAAFGLTENFSRLIIETKTEQHRFKIGKRNYGTSFFFVEDEDKKKVLLISDKIIGDFQKSSARLFERKISRIMAANMDKAVLKFANESKQWTQSGNDKGLEKQWQEEGAEPNRQFGRWLKKLLRLRLEEYADARKNEQMDARESVFSVELFAGKTSEDLIEFKKIGPGKSQPVEYWLKTRYLGSYVKVDQNRVKSIEEDMSSFFP